MATLLDYAITSNPDPLQVNGEYSTLTVIGSYSSGRLGASITSITITITTGTGASDLTNEPSSIRTTSPTDWDGSSQETSGVFKFNAPNGGVTVLNDSIVFTFSNIEVNSQAGTTFVKVEENDEGQNFVYLPVYKVPEQFYLNPLLADPLEISVGGTSTLSWSGSSGYHYSITPPDMLANGQIHPLNNNATTTNDAGHPVVGIETKPLSATTTFTLSVAIVSKDPEPPFISESITVTVNTPKVNSFTVNGTTVTGISDPINCDLDTPMTFAWNVSYADYVILLFNGEKISSYPTTSSGLDVDGSVGLNITSSGTYSIKAYASCGNIEVMSDPSNGMQINLNPPEVLSFTASNTTIYANYKAVTLSWTTKNATTVQLFSQLLNSDGQPASSPIKISFIGDNGQYISYSSYPVYPTQSTRYFIEAVYDVDSASNDAIFVAEKQMQHIEVENKAVVSEEISVDVIMNPCPFDITLNTLTTGNSSTPRDLHSNINSVAIGLAGFNYSFDDGDDHELEKMAFYASSSYNGTTLTVTPQMSLTKEDGTTISNNSTLSVLSITSYDNTQDLFYLENINVSYSKTQYTLPNDNPDAIFSILGGFDFSSNNGRHGKISSFNGSVLQPNTIMVDPDSGQTTLIAQSSAECKGDETYYWGMNISLLEQRNVPQGTGIDFAVVDNGTSSVKFDYPILGAWTVLTNWSVNSTDSDEHDIQQLRCDVVGATWVDNVVTLNWANAYWYDGKHTWYATRSLVVVVAYADHRL